MYCPSFPEAPTMHTLISSSHQLTGTQIWPAFRARHEKGNSGVTEAQQGRPQCSGVSERLPAFLSSVTILRARTPPRSHRGPGRADSNGSRAGHREFLTDL